MGGFRKTVMTTALATGIATGAVWESKAVAAEKPMERDPSYVSAMSVLKKEEARMDAEKRRKAEEEKARYETPKKPAVTCADLDRICVEGKDDSFVLNLNGYEDRMTVAEFRTILSEKQSLELDRILTGVMNGEKRKTLLEEYKQIEDTVAELTISSERPWTNDLIYYMTPEQVKELRVLMISLDSKNAEKIITKHGARKAEERKNEEERKKQEERDLGARFAAILASSLVGLMFAMGSKESRRNEYAIDDMKSAFGTVLASTAIGGIASLLMNHSFSGLGWGFLVGSVIASVSVIFSIPGAAANEESRERWVNETYARYDKQIKELKEREERRTRDAEQG